MRFIKILSFLFLFFLQAVVAEEIAPTTTVNIPMRDGTELPTDIYLPKDSNETTKFPCILLRSPAGRNANSAKAFISLTKHGYTVAIQDTRSVLDHEGKTMPYWTDGWGRHQDGYDTVEWLAKSPYSNGSIGTVGVSALGITQLLMAPSAPPSLKCQYIGMAASSLYHHAIFPGGQLLKNQVEGWLGLYAKDPELLQCLCAQPTYNTFWKQFDSLQVVDKVKAAGFHYAGWYDIFVQGTIDAYVSRQEQGGEGARNQQKLLLGPWTHFWPTNLKLGDFEVPLQGRNPPIDTSTKRWFDHYLKGIQNGVADIPNVTYYVMGTFDGSPSSGNVWRHADHWPVPAVSTAFYFTPDQKLTELKNSHKGEATFVYQYDPNSPVSTVGGCNLFLESGPKDQREIEQREDVLVFTSDPLTEDLEMTGRVLAKIYFSSDQPDTDVVVRLCDVYPDGRSILISDGIRRTGTLSEQEHDKAQAVDVDLLSTSLVFTKGHRIRVSISSSNYPRYEKNNHGNDETPPIANNTVHVGGVKASQITLPLVRRGNTWLNQKG